MDDAPQRDAVDRLLQAADAGPKETMERIARGANNRVYRLRAGGQDFLLKSYFRDPGDPRDRLAAEWAFARFAWDRGLRSLPRPIARDASAGLALFEFVAGSSPTPTALSSRHIDEALGFIEELQEHRTHAAARDLPLASEACFSIREHVSRVAERVQRLAAVTPTTTIEREAHAFVDEQILPAWEDLQRQAAEAFGDDASLPADDRILSPSDFGFHNAIETSAGKLTFIDFEYAGWDDPAKLVCDFFSQVAVPVPPTYLGTFKRRIAELTQDPQDVMARVDVLLPIYRVKWTCILLNDFLPAGHRRRGFAVNDLPEVRQRRQLEKARRALVTGVPVRPGP